MTSSKPITEISRDFRFEAAHRLPNVPPDHKCFQMHGHSFRVTVVVEGELDPKLGWICDFAELARAWEPFHRALDHKVLNDVPGLENPTSELLAHYVAQRFDPPGGRLARVTVHETCTSSCTVRL